MTQLPQSSKINISAYINNQTGYGIMSKNIVLKILNKVHGTVFNLGNKLSCDTKEEFDIINNSYYRNTDVITFTNTSPSLRISHQHDLYHHITYKKERAKFGFTVFELDRLKNYEINSLNANDIIFVPTKWAKEI